MLRNIKGPINSSAIVSQKAREAGLIPGENHLTYPVVMRQGNNDQGKTIRYYLNYSDKTIPVLYNYNKGTSLLTDATLRKGDKIILDPWGVVIVEE